MNDQQKKFFAAAASYILGEKSGVKLVGSSGKLDVARDAIHASRELYEALSDTTSGMKKIKALLEIKHQRASQFEHETGIRWIL